MNFFIAEPQKNFGGAPDAPLNLKLVFTLLTDMLFKVLWKLHLQFVFFVVQWEIRMTQTFQPSFCNKTFLEEIIQSAVQQLQHNLRITKNPENILYVINPTF